MLQPPTKTRDSQKILHFLRKRLDPHSNNRSSGQNPDGPRSISKSANVSTMSVRQSSHYSEYSIKNKCDKYEHQLLDVEDLSKVYNVIREQINVPRPDITLAQKETNKEFEEKVNNDREFREKMIKQQATKVTKQRDAKRARDSFSQRMFRPGSSRTDDLINNSYSLTTQNLNDSVSYIQENEEISNLSLEAVRAKKRVGQYSVEIKRHTGRKIAYQVFTYLEKPRKENKAETQEFDNDDDFVDKVQRQIEEKKKNKNIEKEEQNPYLKVLVKDCNPFKRESYYVPMKDEELDLENRMKKKWNPPGWMQFSGGNARSTVKKPWMPFNEVIKECQSKLKSTKANHSFNDYNDRDYIKNLHTLSSSAQFKDASFDREFNISLKHPTLVQPKVKLTSLAEKVEDRNRIFGKLKEEEKSKKKSLKEELERKIDLYYRYGNRQQKPSRSMDRSGNFSRGSVISRGLKQKNIKFDPSKSTSQRESHRDKLNLSEAAYTSSESGLSPKESVRGAAGAAGRYVQSGDSIPTHENNENKAFTFLTQNEKDASALAAPAASVNKDQTQQQSILDQSHMSIESALRSLTPPKTLAHLDSDMPSNAGRKRAQTVAKGSLLHVPSAFQQRSRGISVVSRGGGGPRRSVLSNISSNIDNMDLDERILENTDEGFFSNRKDVDEVVLQKKTKNIRLPVNEIEDKLNKTFNSFVNVKTQADNKFKAAVNIIMKDRPILNKIRYTKYQVDKMVGTHIDKFRGEAETFRVDRYKRNHDQRDLYIEICDYIVNQELNENKLTACYYFMNVFKELLERGDVLTKEGLNQLLAKVDEQRAITPLFLGVVAKIMDKLKMKPDEIWDEDLKKQLQIWTRNMSLQKHAQDVTPKN